MSGVWTCGAGGGAEWQLENAVGSLCCGKCGDCRGEEPREVGVCVSLAGHEPTTDDHDQTSVR